MKNTSPRSFRGLAFIAGTALLFASSPLLRAHDDDKKGAEMAPPTTAVAALEQVHHLHMELADQVKDKNLKTVHETAEKLTELLNMLPALSKDLPADRLKRVEGAVKNLAKALDDLHDAADEGKQAETEKQLGTVGSLLKLLTAQYPKAGM